MAETCKLYFSREFVKGSLKGIVQHDALPFSSPERGMSWVKAIQAKARAGKLDYKLIDYTFQKRRCDG